MEPPSIKITVHCHSPAVQDMGSDGPKMGLNFRPGFVSSWGRGTKLIIFLYEELYILYIYIYTYSL